MKPYRVQWNEALLAAWSILTLSIVTGLVQNEWQGRLVPPRGPFRAALSVPGLDAGVAQGLDACFLDVRGDLAYRQGHVAGAYNYDRLPDGPPRGRPLIVYCSSTCGRDQSIAVRLAGQGYSPVYVLRGGFESWTHRPIRQGDQP